MTISKRNKITIFLFLNILSSLTTNLFAFELYHGKKLEADLGFIFGFEYSYEATLLPGIGGYDLTKAQTTLEGKYLENLNYKLSLDFSEVETDNGYTTILKDANIRYDFSDFFRIKLGRFKVPFGQEISNGTVSRPYMNHSEGSELIAPGRSQGISFSGKNIFNSFSYNLGIYNDSDTIVLENETGHYLFTGLVSYEYKFLETSYNILYSTDETFAHGLSIDLNFDLKENRKLRFFSEFLEQRYYNYYWNHSLFSFVALRINSIEPVLYFDYYNENIGYDGEEDKLIPGIGLNEYFLNDKLKIMVDLHTSYFYSLEDSTTLKFYDHTLAIKLILEMD